MRAFRYPVFIGWCTLVCDLVLLALSVVLAPQVVLPMVSLAVPIWESKWEQQPILNV